MSVKQKLSVARPRLQAARAARFSFSTSSLKKLFPIYSRACPTNGSDLGSLRSQDL